MCRELRTSLYKIYGRWVGGENLCEACEGPRAALLAAVPYYTGTFWLSPSHSSGRKYRLGCR